MKIIKSSNELTNEFKRLMNSYNEYFWTVAWADYNFEISSLLKKRQTRIKRICVGLQFYGTHPEFIEAFYKHNGVRFIDRSKGTYHPKLYLFQNNPTEWEILIGSGNFTASAFSANVEAAVIITSSDNDTKDFYKNSIEFVNVQWKLGKLLSDKYVREYKLRKEKVKTIIPKLPIEGIRQPIFEKSWKQYLLELKGENYKSRIKFLDWARERLITKTPFDEIDLQTRKSIAGFGLGEKDTYGIDIGFFGTTRARGFFMKSIINKPKIITQALLKIPKDGEVTSEHYFDFIKEFRKVSKYQELACATRMLCLWRPDYFVNFNGKNKDALCNELQVKNSKVNYSTYWDLIVQPFIDSDWTIQANPRSKNEKEIFNYRVALLDSIYYKWS